jgi:hypothetical protein
MSTLCLAFPRGHSLPRLFVLNRYIPTHPCHLPPYGPNPTSKFRFSPLFVTTILTSTLRLKRGLTKEVFCSSSGFCFSVSNALWGLVLNLISKKRLLWISPHRGCFELLLHSVVGQYLHLYTPGLE